MILQYMKGETTQNRKMYFDLFTVLSPVTLQYKAFSISSLHVFFSFLSSAVLLFSILNYITIPANLHANVSALLPDNVKRCAPEISI